MNKLLALNDTLRTYIFEHHSAEDPLLIELREETQRKAGDRAIMQISADEGILLGMLVALRGARSILEVGTFTGYSSISMARHMPPGGKMLCCDVSEEWTAVARRYWERAGVADRIELRIGPAAETIRGLPEREQFDFAFIDADKENCMVYYEEILKRLEPNGVIAVDNVLRRGRVIDPAYDDDPGVTEMRRLNDHIIADPRVEAVLLHVTDGLNLIRKRRPEETAG